MGRILRWRGDRHRDVQLLLPWYAIGRLDAEDQAEVEAHLRQCPQCQAELAAEQQLAARCAELPANGVEQGWAAMQRRMARTPARRGLAPILAARLAFAGDGVGRMLRGGPPWLGWAMGAQLFLLLAASVIVAPRLQPARYHALGAAPAPAAANIVVMFRPETSERDLRRILDASHARLVDGPTAADAYLLHVPIGERAEALVQLHGQADVALAEPIDAAGPP